MLAQTIKAGETGSLKIAISRGLDLRLVLPHLNALRETVRRLDYRLMRGSGDELVEWLKGGEAELALGDLKDPLWERIDRWTIFDAPFRLVFSRTHRLANRGKLTIDDLRGELILLRTHCDRYAATAELLTAKGLLERLDVASDNDVFALLEANMGVALLPRTATVPQTLTRGTVEDLALSHRVSLYAVAGRQRSPVAATFMKMLRAANWTAAVE
jgi:DNA-binding transcriptional LysR family regulator